MKENRCTACENVVKNGRFVIDSYNGLELIIERFELGKHYRLHNTDGYNHTTRAVFYCPFCGIKSPKV